MNWDLSVEHRRDSLLGLVLALLTEIGLAGDDAVERLSKPVYQYALTKLRKAESAVRRLIFVAARNIVLEPPPECPARARPEIPSKGKGQADGEAKAEARPKRKRRPLFKLFDPARRLKKLFGCRYKRNRAEPRIHFFDFDPRIPLFLRQPPAAPTAPAPVEEGIADEGMVDARKLIRRFVALTDALEDIPGQAMRLARWQAKPIEERRPERWSPLRSGRPPGYRERPKHEIDEILKECDWLARNVMPPLDDTS